MPANMARKELDSIRVDQVGSLVGPHHLREMVERNERGEASADDMRQAQDAAIRDLILKQEAIGLPVLTDGDTQQNFFVRKPGHHLQAALPCRCRRTIQPSRHATSFRT